MLDENSLFTEVLIDIYIKYKLNHIGGDGDCENG